jgi:uncharacterized protein with ParB-like and HNH nuclease domain
MGVADFTTEQGVDMANTQEVQTIKSLDLSVEELFNDFYIVPSYQREYVWEREEVEQLLHDIYDAFPMDREMLQSDYFIGSLVVCPSEGDMLELIDGQQRMTTAYLFLCAVRDHLQEIGAEPIKTIASQVADMKVDDYGQETYRYRVNLQYEDSLEVVEHIAKGHDKLNEIATSTRSVENLLGAYHTIRLFLNNEFREDTLEKTIAEIRRFYAYFIHKVKVVRIRTENIAHALKVFETINERGVGLDSMDLLKNLMFMQADKPSFDKLKTRWKELIDVLHQSGEKPLRFLRYFVLATYDVERLREKEIYEWFVEHADICGYTEDPIGHVDLLNEAARAYTRFVGGRNIDGTENRYLKNLGYLSGVARQHLILLLAGRHLPVDDFIELSRYIENLFFAYIITREPTRRFESAFAQWAGELRDVQDPEELDAFLDLHFRPEKEELATRFELAFEELDDESIQKYRMRYILGKMTQYVNEHAYGPQANDLGKFVKKKDVEHILPQTPTPEVLAAFDRPDEIEYYIHRLGNMAILEEPLNRSAGNKAYSEKRKYLAQSQFLLTKSIAVDPGTGGNTAIDRAVEGLVTFDKWTSDSIEERQKMLTELATSVWGMPEGTETEADAER